MTRTTILCTMLLSLAALPTHAQTVAVAVPEPGARVRVVALSSSGRWEPVVGTLVAAGSDSLVLRPERSGETVVLRPEQMRALQVSTGRESRVGATLRHGAAAGTVGIVGGCAVGAYFAGEAGCLLLGGLTGALSGLGGLIHGGSKGRERWSPATLPGPTPDIGVRADGGVSVSITLKT